MRSITQLTLLLLTTLCSANNLNLYNSNGATFWPGHFTSSKSSGCIKPSDVWDRNSYIVFNSKNTDDAPFNFSISTHHTKYYPHTLQNLLQAYNFDITLESSVDASECCGWWDTGAVKARGITRGHILWKYNDLRRVRAPPNSGRMSGWYANREDHIPPRMSHRPSNETIAFLTQLLLSNGPYADVYFNWTLCLTALCAWFTVMMLIGLAHKVARAMQARTQARLKMEEAEDDIELSMIEPQRAAGFKSSESTGSEPLPRYSVDGAGR
ncbi:hypothetical protein P153DRAFT_367573 [Dothidotthia symphoricarpi CBS 119687]|uniref:Uncharacterized protein n=1 Tax=Dothidotthia symphoricarpi CBS 119687 TaxID=1392245 RepID=A0A6A6ACH7_9PLEO|nr:uncharacterized protein P153DRAFT_367573 [Dothidotthia symphoricarpi CBS 119687]KAF2128431.1 hypothetical protein P153DRAFT_367573 [Dothidotthia symphoricarpi CBS 119687]